MAFGQGLVALQVVGAEGDQCGQPGVGRSQRTQRIVVVAVQVYVAVNQPRQHEHARGVNVLVRRGQQVLRPNGGNLLPVNGNGGLVNLRRRNNTATYDNGVYMPVSTGCGHGGPPWECWLIGPSITHFFRTKVSTLLSPAVHLAGDRPGKAEPRYLVSRYLLDSN